MTAANNGSPTAAGGADSNGGIVTANLAAYVPGTYKRQKSWTLATSQGNFTHYGWFFDQAAGSAMNGGAKVRLINPATIVKTSQYKLTLTLEVSWGRA